MDDEEVDLYYYRAALRDSLLYTVALIGIIAIIACLL